MSAFAVLFRKEMRSTLLAPATWLVLAAFAVAQAFAFILSVNKYQTGPMPFDLVFLHFNLFPTLFWLPYLFLFPLVTMRSFAEEERQGTIEPLMTAPVRTLSLVLAKYAASFCFYLLLWLPTVLFFVFFQQLTGQSPVQGDAGQTLHLGGYIGSGSLLLAMGAAFLAVGCLCSALTGNQLAAAVLTFVILLLHLALGSLILVYEDLPRVTRSFLEFINSTEHLKRFAQGVIDSRVLIYYFSLAAALIYLTHRVFDFRRWQR